MSSDLKSETSFALILLATIISATVFFIDVSLPLGVAGGVPYVALVLLGWWFPKRQMVFHLAAVATLLTVVGAVYSPSGGIVWVVLLNRAYALFAIWSVALILRVARRTSSHLLKSESKLKAAKHKAETANRAKSDLLANTSHELRTPLNAIIGFSETMKKETFGSVGSDKNREYLDDIHHSGQHLLELINDILDVSAIEGGALELSKENIDIYEVAEAAIRIMQPRAERGKVNISSLLEQETPLIYADGRRVRQVMLNLLSNAVKFTPEGGKVLIDSLLNDDGSLSLFISDTGYGMSDDETAIALTKFGQVERGYNRKHEGTGMGLPLTMGLMKLHGGTLEIDSLEGYGTMVTITFPKERVTQNVS